MPKTQRRIKAKAAAQPLAQLARWHSRWRGELVPLYLARLRFWLIVFVVFTLPLIIYLPNTEYGYTKSIFLYISVSFLAILWTIELLLTKEPRIGLTRLAWPALGLFAAAALSLINVESLLISLESFVGLIYFGLLGLMVANTVQSERDLKILLGALVLAAALGGLYGLLQYYGWLPGVPGFSTGSLTMISTFGNPNYLAGFLAHLFVPSCWLFLSARSLWARLALLPLLVLITAALVAASSAGAWGAAILSGLVFLVGILIFRLGAALRGQRRWTLALVFILGMTIWLQAPPGPLNALLTKAATLETSNPVEQIAQWVQRVWEENSGWIRAWNWWIGYEMLRAHPYIGVGLGDYKLEFLEYKARFEETPRGEQFNFYMPRAIQAHNDYVQLVAELGIVGIIAIGFFFGMLFAGAWGFLKAPVESERRLGVLALSAGGVALMVDALFSFPLHLPASEMNLLLFIALLHTRPLLSPEPLVTLSRNSRRIVSAVAIGLALIVSIFAYRDWLGDLHLDRAQAELQRARPNYRLVREELEQSIALDLAPSKAYYYLGLIYAELGQVERGVEHLKRSLKNYPTENTYIQLAELDVRVKQYERADRHLQTLLRLVPEPLMQLEAQFMRRVIIPLQRGERDLAWLEINKFLQEHPDYSRAYLVRGELHRALGQHEAARAQYQEGLNVTRAQKQHILTRLDEVQKTRRLSNPDELQRLRDRAAALVQMEAQFEQLIAGTR